MPANEFHGQQRSKAVTGDNNALARPKMKLFYSPEKVFSEGEACKNRVLLFTWIEYDAI